MEWSAPDDTLNVENCMLYWTSVLFVIAVTSGILVFGVAAAGASILVKMLFVMFMVLVVFSLIVVGSGRSGPSP
jgi:uncharacterized membrane protein YtjA (UPF0391 family)